MGQGGVFFKEFEPRLKIETRFHLALYSMFRDLSRRTIGTAFWWFCFKFGNRTLINEMNLFFHPSKNSQLCSFINKLIHLTVIHPSHLLIGFIGNLYNLSPTIIGNYTKLNSETCQPWANCIITTD